MKSIVVRVLDRVAPGTMAALRDLQSVRAQYGSLHSALELVGADGIDEVVQENQRLRNEIDELRREGRYVAELYDLVVERVRSDSHTG